MYSVTNSFGLNGLRGFAVAVEADVSGGLPAFSIVGLPDSAVRESADRVRAAIKNLGFRFPDRRITINLAPADVRKTGPVYDLPLLLALLTASGQLEEVPADAAFLGELALDGSLRPVSGVLPMALAAAEYGIRALYVPAENAAEAAEACADTMTVYPAHTAREVVEALKGTRPLSPAAAIPFDPEDAWQQVPDFADVMGQSLARRAMVIAAAGGHNVLLTGAPGTGKSMLAKRLPGILPPLTREEAVETTKIYSIAGQLPQGRGLISARPFRSPHHSAALLKQEDKPIYVAVNEEDVCMGYAFCQLKEQPFSTNMVPFKSLFIDDLCVDKQTRGQHIGESLFDYVKQQAKALGCYEVTLNVWAGNTSAEHFYEKMGMKTKERQMEYIL